MSRVRSRLALVLVPALAPLAFALAVEVARTVPDGDPSGGTAALGANRIDVRLGGDERRDGAVGQRLLKHRQAVLGVLAFALALPLVAGRRIVPPGRAASLAARQWSPPSVRAPPSRRLVAV